MKSLLICIRFHFVRASIFPLNKESHSRLYLILTLKVAIMGIIKLNHFPLLSIKNILEMSSKGTLTFTHFHKCLKLLPSKDMACKILH